MTDETGMIDITKEYLTDEMLYDCDAATQFAEPRYGPGMPAIEKQKLLGLEAALKKRIIGQDAAISTVCRAIRRNRAGFRDAARPVGSFIFVGPSGVGKTELCRALAEVLYGNAKNLLKIDMSECMSKHEASKLTGAAPGYTGYDNGGRLTNLVKQNPRSVLCFDEIEKAHPDIFDLFLQILEDGVLTSGQGETVSFAEVLIIMTSNIGSDKTEGKIGFGDGDSNSDSNRQHVSELLKNAFRPEFLGRLDGLIVFNELREADVFKICGVMLRKVRKTAKELGINLSFDKTAAAELARLGFDKNYGARPLRGVIAAKVTDVLSDMIFASELNIGDSVRVKFNGKDFIMENKKAARTAKNVKVKSIEG